MNFCGIIVGPAGAGKTVLARQVVREFLLEFPCGIVLAHDPCREYASATRYEDASAARAAISSAARTSERVPRVLSIGGPSEGVTSLATAMGRAWNSADSVRVPILVTYDEAQLLSGSGPTHQSRIDGESLAIRRHLGVASLYCCQRPTQLPAQFWSMATVSFVFTGPSTTAKKIEEVFLLEPGALDGIRRLPRFSYVMVRPAQVCVDMSITF